MKEKLAVPAMILGLVCFICIGVGSSLHFGFKIAIHSGDHVDLFNSDTIYWLVSLSFAAVGGLLMDLKHPLTGVFVGLVVGILMLLAYWLYLHWRIEISMVEILIPPLIPFLLGIRLRDYLINRGAGI